MKKRKKTNYSNECLRIQNLNGEAKVKMSFLLQFEIRLKYIYKNLNLATTNTEMSAFLYVRYFVAVTQHFDIYMNPFFSLLWKFTYMLLQQSLPHRTVHCYWYDNKFIVPYVLYSCLPFLFSFFFASSLCLLLCKNQSIFNLSISMKWKHYTHKRLFHALSYCCNQWHITTDR